MCETTQKCENTDMLKQNYTLKLLIYFKMAYSCCFILKRNLDFLKKKFKTSTACCNVQGRSVSSTYTPTIQKLSFVKRCDK